MKRISCCIFILFVIFSPLQAQTDDPRNETFEQFLATMPDDFAQVDSFAEFAWKLQSTDSIHAIDYARRGLVLARKLDYPIGTIDCINRKARLFEIQGKYDLAIDDYQLALAIALENNLSFPIGRGYHQMSICYRKKEAYEQALDYAQQAIEVFKQLPDKKQYLSVAYANLATIHQLEGKLTEALEVFELSFDALKGIEAPYQKASILNGRGFLYEQLNLFDSAIKEHREGLKLSQEIGDQYGINIALIGLGTAHFQQSSYDSALVFYQGIPKDDVIYLEPKAVADMYHNIGRIFLAQKEADSALRYFQMSLDIREELENKQGLAESFKDLGALMFQNGKYQEARTYLLQCLTIAEEINQLSIQSEANQTLAYVYGKLDSAERVVACFAKSNSIQDSLSQLQNQTADLALRFQMAQTRLKELEGDKEKSSLLFTGSLIGTFLLLMIGVMVILWQRSRQKVIVALKNEEIAKANATISGEEKERERISKELHDHVGAILSMVRTTLSELDEEFKGMAEEKHNKYEKANGLLNQAIGSLREISQKLGNSMLRNLGLIPTLEALANDIEESTELETSFFYLGIDMEDRFESSWEDNLYKIILELSVNSIKHAQAKQLSISLIREEEEVEVMIQDDGVGFDPKQKKANSLGLLNLQSRLEALNGDSELDSSPGNGTTYTIRIPISHHINPKHS